MDTFSITEWKEHQHYGEKRDPTWVKLYQKTLTSVTWIKADALTRGIMLASLLLAARHKNTVPIDSDVLIPALAPSASKWSDVLRSLRYLEAHGFIEINASPEHASDKVLAQNKKEEEESKNKIPPKSPKGDEHESFPDFWKAYPSRGNAANPRKPAAKAHLAAIKRGADPAELIRLAPTAAPADKHGTEFVPQATTWLNEDRYKDAPKAVEPPRVQTEEDQWRHRVKNWIESPKPIPERYWFTDQWGPAPHLENTKVPKKLLAEFGVAMVDELAIPAFLRREKVA